MIPTLVRGALRAASAALFVASSSLAAQNAAPEPSLYVVDDVRLLDQADAPHVRLVLRDGRIERVLDAGAELPAGARVVDGKGMLALPALIDAYTLGGCETPTPVAQQDAPPSEASDVYVDMRQANRKGIQPAFRAAGVFSLPKDKSKPWRESGFGALLSAPAGQLLAGTSALCTTRDAAVRDVMLDAEVFAHAAFRASGPGYPSTLMGYHAQLRQFFMDVRRQLELRARYDAGRPGPRPAFDAELEAGALLAAKQRRVMCEAESAQDIRRWIEFADELGLEIGIVGGREAWKVAGELAARAIPVVLTLEWGDEPKDPHEKDKQSKSAAAPKEQPKKAEAETQGANATTDAPAAESRASAEQAPKADEQATEAKADPKAEAKKWEYQEPLGVREFKRKQWEEGRDCAKKLHEARVVFAFGSGSGNGADLLKKARTTVEHGLPAEVALAALTTQASKLLGADGHIGSVRVGADATLALWTANPLTKDAKLAWLFVDGFAHEFEIKDEPQATGKPDDGVDASGTWDLEIKSERGTSKGTLELTMEPDGDVTGKLTTTSQGGNERTLDVRGHVGGKTMTLSGTFTMRDAEATQALKLELDGDALSGSSSTRAAFGEFTSEVSGTRRPRHQAEEVRHEGGCGDEHP